MEKRDWFCLALGLSCPLTGLVHVIVWLFSNSGFATDLCFWLWCIFAPVGLVAPWFGNRRALPWVFALALLAPMGAIHAFTAMMVFKLGSGAAFG